MTLAMIHLGKVIDQPVKLRAINHEARDLAVGRRRYGQQLIGGRELRLVLDLPMEMDSVVAQGLVGIPLESGSEAAIDAVCELVNIIGGTPAPSWSRTV